MTSIYALREPITRRIRYVGATRLALHKRLLQHIGNAQPTAGAISAKNYWLVHLKLAGGRPTIELLEDVPDWAAAGAENTWIRRLHEQGEPLLNHPHGRTVDLRARPADPAFIRQRRR